MFTSQVLIQSLKQCTSLKWNRFKFKLTSAKFDTIERRFGPIRGKTDDCPWAYGYFRPQQQCRDTGKSGAAIRDTDRSDASGETGTAQDSGHKDPKQELVHSFDRMKEALKTICDSLQLPLSEEILNCTISFNKSEKVASDNEIATEKEASANEVTARKVSSDIKVTTEKVTSDEEQVVSYCRW